MLFRPIVFTNILNLQFKCDPHKSVVSKVVIYIFVIFMLMNLSMQLAII